MRAFVAYSRPRGIHGRAIFTILIYYIYPTESAKITVSRSERQYGCNDCGIWATISTTSAINPSEHEYTGTLEFFRYDNVEPGDIIEIRLDDSELLFYQLTTLIVTQQTPYMRHNISAYHDMPSDPMLDPLSHIPLNHVSSGKLKYPDKLYCQ